MYCFLLEHLEYFTELILKKKFCFLRYPRINKESLLPVAKNVSYSGENTEALVSSGHGDTYASFYNSGLLDTFIGEERIYFCVQHR